MKRDGVQCWRWRVWAGLVFFIGLLGAVSTAFAQAERTFTLNNVDVRLADVSAEADVYFRSMRLNRALDVWNVEASVSNKVGRVISGPLVLLVEGFTNTTGPRQADGTIEGEKQFYDLSGLTSNGALAPGEVTAPRTLTLGRSGSGSPTLDTRVYAGIAQVAAALGVTRSLNAAGQPLPGVRLSIAGPGGAVEQSTDGDSGVSSFGQGAGEHVVKFSAEGYLPVWRRQALLAEETTLMPNARLTRRSENAVLLTPLGGTVVKDAAETIAIEFGAGAVSQGAEVRLTLVTGQSLPAFLPLGWSPLNAFWVESTVPLGGGVSARLKPWGSIGGTDTVVLVKWDEMGLRWMVLQIVAGNGSNGVTVNLAGAGAYALVVGDAGETAPPAVRVGEGLGGFNLTTAIDAAGLTALGRVNPPASPASLNAELVTGTAEVELRHAGSRLPSGYLLRGEVTETYLLSDGSLRLTPQYEHFIAGYQRPGDQDAFTLHASFPMRPLLLFGPEQLEEATVRVDVLPEQPFDGTVLDENGGQVSADGVRLMAGSGRLTGPSAVRLRRLDGTVFTNLVGGGQSVVAVFELVVDSSTLGDTLSAQLSGAPGNGLFVLARVLSETGYYGLQPVERLESDGAGSLSSLEPVEGERLPGLRGSGQFVLVQVGERQGVIGGVARNGANAVQAGMPVRLTGVPWLSVTDALGRFQLVGPMGAGELSLLDPVTGDTGFVTVEVVDPAQGLAQDLGTAASGPRVARITPGDGAVRVRRVGSVVIEFNEAVNPGTVVGAIELVNPENSVVGAALTLNLPGTVATLSPAVELEANTEYRVRLAASLADPGGLPLEGQREFAFTTVPLSSRDPAAQLIIYQPGATNVPPAVLAQIPAYEPGTDPFAIVVRGTPGVADPEVPVVLVNESTGETATVLSQVDGSFASVITGTEEDFVSATFVNLNGTRVYVPVSRQEFDDGFVGLYPQGGILEAESDGGLVRVLIEPEAVKTRSQVRLKSLSLAQVLEALNGVAPEAGKVVGRGIEIELKGDQLAGESDVEIPVTVAELDLPAGVPPEEGAYALTVVREIGGNRVFEVVDRLKFEEGRLVRNSFDGWAQWADGVRTLLPGDTVFSFILVPLVLGDKPVSVLGKVYHVPQLSAGTVLGDAIANQLLASRAGKPLSGAFVSLHLPGTPNAVPGRLRPGMVYSTSNRDGEYALVAPSGTSDSVFSGYHVAASHPRYADRPVEPVFLQTDFSLGGVIRKDLIFREPAAFQSPPSINASHSPIFPAPGQACSLQVNASQGAAAAPVVTVTVEQVVPLAQGVEATTSDVQITNIQQTVIQGNRKRWSGTVFTEKLIRVVLKIETGSGVEGNSGGSDTSLYAIDFRSDLPPPPDNEIPPSDPDDKTGPVVTASFPGDGDYVGAVAAVRILFNEPIDRTVQDDFSAITLSGPGEAALSSAILTADQKSLTLMLGGLLPDAEYTLTLSSSAIQDLSGNELDQRPSTALADSYSLKVRTMPVVKYDLPGLENGSGVALHGTRLYALQHGNQHKLVLFDITDPSNPSKLSEVTLPGYPRDVAVIPDYSFKLNPAGPVTTSDLVAVTGGDLGSQSIDAQGNVFLAGQYLRVFDVGDPSAPRRLASPVITLRNAAISKLVWAPPHLAYKEFGSDIQQVGFINLQEFLVGFNATPEEAQAFPLLGVIGKDNNGDGDFVDAGDQFPLPERNPPEFYGKKFAYVVDETPQRLLDFAVAGGTVGVTLTKGQRFVNGLPTGPEFKPAYRTVAANGFDVDRIAGTFEFGASANPKRVSLYDALPVEIDGQITTLTLALVSLSPDHDGSQKLAVLDVTLPESPEELSRIEIPDELAGGFLQSIHLNDQGLLELATTSHLILLDPTHLAAPNPSNDALHRAIVGYTVGAGSGNQRVGTSPFGVYAVNLGARQQVIQSAPRMSFVSFPARSAVFDSASLPGSEADLDALWEQLSLTPAIIPARLRPHFTVESDLDPPSPQSHYHVLVEAPGGAGQTLELGLESLNRAGQPMASMGLNFPPVRAATGDTVSDIGQEPRAGCDAPVRPLTAYRMSDDPRSPFYSRYLSKPFAVTYERVSVADLSELQSALDREVIWSGRFVRAFIDPAMTDNAVIGPFAAEVEDDLKRIRPRAGVVAAALDSSYVMGANPPPAGGYHTMPGTFGNVSAHSGEFRHQTMDLALPSPRMSIEIERTIGGRDLYDGPFGRGWDFNYNQRVVELERQIFPVGREMPLVVRATEVESIIGKSRDVLFHSGAGRVIHFAHQGTSAPTEFTSDPLVQELGWLDTVSDFFLPEKGEFDLLVKFQDGRYERLEPDGTRYQYAANGRLEVVIDRYPVNRHELEYDKRGWLVRITDKSVTDDRFVEIGYNRFGSDGEFNSDLDEETDNAFLEGKICRLADYAGRDVLFFYSEEGVLIRREGPELAGDNGGFSDRPVVHYVWDGCNVQGVVPGQDSTPLFAGSLSENNRGEWVVTGSGTSLAGAVSLAVGTDNDAASNQGQVSSATLSDGTTARFTFDKMGYPTRFETGGGPGGGSAGVDQQFTEHGLLKFVKHPEGNSETRVYDEANPVFRSRGNLLSSSYDPGPRGGEVLTESWSYDPRYNLYSGVHKDLNDKSIDYSLSGDGRDAEDVSYPGAGALHLTYNDRGQVLSETRPNGVQVAFDYSAADGFLTSLRLGANPTGFGYDGSIAGKLGSPTTITPPAGTPYTRKYDALLNLVENARGGLVEKFAYDEFSNLTLHSRTVGEGKTLTLTRSYTKKVFMDGLTVSGVEVNGAAATLNYVYTPDDRLRVKTILHPGASQNFDYDNRGFLTRTTLGEYTEEYARDRHGNVVELKQGGETVETTRHDGHDRPVEIKRKTGAQGEDIEIRSYHGGGEIKSIRVTDAAFGAVWERAVPSLDGLGRPEKTEIIGDTITYSETYTYLGGNGGSVSAAGPRQTVTRSWDTAGYPTGLKNANTTATITPNANGLIKDIRLVEDGATFSRAFGYDDRDHLESVDDSLANLYQFTPRVDGRPVVVRNARGNEITQSFSAFGDLAERRRADGMTFRFHYNERRQPTFTGDASQQGHAFGYDDTFRQTEMKLRNGGAFGYSDFDGRNRPKSISMPGGGMTLDYDRQGRLTSQTVNYGGANFDLALRLDALDRVREATYNGNGATYDYDAAGPLLRAVFKETGGDFTVGYALYPDGQRKSVIYPSGPTVDEDRDGAGRLSKLSVDGISLLDVQSWHGNASPKTVFIGNGVITLANAYDARPRLLGSRYTRATDGAMLVDLRYRYDAADNLTARQFVHRGGRADFFAYDDGERVDTAHIGARPFATGVAARTEGPYAPTEGGFGPGYYARDFNYDSSGLDYLTTVSLTKPASVRAAPFASNWGGHDAFLHATTVDGFNRGAPDPLGNVTTASLQIRLPNAAGSSPVGGRLTYNGLSMLTRIERTDGVVIENSYQHNGLRHFRKVSPPAGAALESAYIYDEGRLIEEYQDAGSGQQLVGRYYYAHDDAPVAADLRHPVTGLLQRYYYLRDNTLSIVGVADAAGQVVERVVYDAFGQPVIETADDTPPTIANVIAGAGGSWLVVLSESVLVPLGNLAAGPDLVTASGSLANSISVRDNVTGLPLAGSALLEEAAAGFDFARVLRFTPTQVPTGSVSLTIPADSVADEWGNLNPAVTVIFTPGGAPGTVLFQAAGVGDTGPRQVARSAVGNPFLFQGQYFDYDAGLVYMRARFYDPFAGQYLQPDPLGYEDSVNLYAGLGNNPTSFRDPTGTANIRITVNRPRGNLVPLSSRVPKGGRTRPDPSEGTPAVTSWTRPERAPRPREASIQVDEAQLHSGGGRSPHAGAELQRDVTQPGVPPPAARRSAGASSGTGPARYALQTEEGIRPVVVVQTSRGPQAFYRSTGGNSGLPNQWLPFEGIDYKLGYIGDFGSFNQGFFQSVGSLMLNKGGFATGRRRGDSLRRFGDPEIVPEEFSRELRSISQRLSRSSALNNLQNYKLLEGAGADGLEQAARVINQHLFDRGARVRPDFDYYFFNALPRGAD